MRTSQARRATLRTAAAIVAGIVLFALTGWPLMLVLAPAAALGIPLLLAAPTNREVDLLVALDRWVRSLAATIPTGRSVTESVRLSVRQAPDLLKEPLSITLLRMDDRWSTPDALRALADDLASPDADAVIAALILAAERGGTGATTTLNALAESIQDRLRALREIETERAKPRIVVRQVTIITLVFLTGSLLLGRAFFEPYGTPLGQVILAALIAIYVGSLVMLRRMTLPRERERILSPVVRS
ncbi:MAG TPA: type II secretion system F family protein [Propionibacteriaceae bacterium]|nr:type II secretion system F family protein [Propionibacteriaceae bacterium]